MLDIIVQQIFFLKAMLKILAQIHIWFTFLVGLITLCCNAIMGSRVVILLLSNCW